MTVFVAMIKFELSSKIRILENLSGQWAHKPQYLKAFLMRLIMLLVKVIFFSII